MHDHSDIRIGTLAGRNEQTAAYIEAILPHGFESFEINFWQDLHGVDLKHLASDTRRVLEGSGAVISCLGVYGNPLDPAHPKQAETLKAWKACIDHAPRFGCDLVCGFAGRIIGKPIPESMKAFRKIFGELSRRAADKGVRIAFENCDMGGNWQSGDWNIAHGPDAWEMMFHEVPAANLGLEWEPCHQMVKLIEPLPQLRKWVKRIFHVHGKDATIYWDVIREHGMGGALPTVHHRTPGFGDTNWSDVISELRRHGFKGAIDIEGWHDPVYRGDLEMTGQVRGLNYLKQCRGGAFIANPDV
ncbi:MAG: sugar phosphate isomerase/epimerase [Lentisphaerae bacterium]|nr:sugar phosphate isomerase/epimerase [Lentisphaerota bacterium]